MRRSYAVILGVLAFAFFLRVLGQVLVAFFQVDFLPPMVEWYSGLLPYPILLPVQLLILFVQARISLDIWRGRGFFAIRRPRVGTFLRWFSFVYFASMVLRYILAMSLHPERRWFSGTIPIFFHMVLACYLFVLARFQDQPDNPSSIGRTGRRN